MASDASRVAELIWRTDNRTAVRGMKEIAEQSDKTKNSIRRDAREEDAAMVKVRESTSLVKDAFMGLAGFVGIAGIGFGLKDVTEGALALQAGQVQLAQALKATGQEAGGTAEELQKMAEAMSTHGGFALTQNLGALTAFVRETHSATESQKLLTLATNIARGRNIDLATAQQAVAKAYTGSTGKLQAMLGPMVKAREAAVGLSVAHQKEIAAIESQASFMAGPLKTQYVQNAEIADHITAQQMMLAEMTDKHTTAQQTLAIATKEFAGATSRYSSTTQGQISNLRNTFQNLADSLGIALLPAINKIIHAFAGVAHWMARNKTLVMDVVLALAGLTAAYGAVKVATASWAAVTAVANTVMKVQAALMVAIGDAVIAYEGDVAAANLATKAWIVTQGVLNAIMDANPIGVVILAVAALAAAAYEVITNWKAVSAFFSTAFKAIGDAAKAAFHWVENAASEALAWIEGHWPIVVGVLTGPIGFAIAEVIQHFHQIEGIVMDVVRFIERVFSTVFDAITYPFRKAWSYIKAGFHDLTGFLHSIPIIGGLIPGLAGGGVVKHLASGGPSGTDTTPAWLTPGEGVVTTQGMRRIGEGGLAAINAGGPLPGGGGYGPLVASPATAPRFSIVPSNVTMRWNVQVMGDALVHWSLMEAARGVGALAGGPIVTGSPGFS